MKLAAAENGAKTESAKWRAAGSCVITKDGTNLFCCTPTHSSRLLGRFCQSFGAFRSSLFLSSKSV